jgi:hypothetical protein
MAETTPESLKDLMPIEKAARAIGRSRESVRQLAIRHRIAVRWGGTDRHPRLRVKLSELAAAVLKERHRPPAPVKTKQRRPSRDRQLDPAVTC